MPVQIDMLTNEDASDRPVLHMSITGKLESNDYDRFVPKLEKQIHLFGKIDLLVELIDFHGWAAGAIWEDTKFAIHHFNNIGKIAVTGDQRWEQWLADFATAFTTADVRYFNISRYQEASEWLRRV